MLVESWRIIATVLFAIGGIVLVLVTMAQARDRKGSTGAQVAISGAVAFTLIVIVGLLIATTLPIGATWTLVAITGGIATFLVLVD